MGAAWSMFGSKLTAKEKLEKIEAEIQSIEDGKWTTIRQEKTIFALLFCSVGIGYGIMALIFIFYQLPNLEGALEIMFYSLPLIVLPFIIFYLKKAIEWYYRWALEAKECKMKELRKEKKQILDKVMETETYKVAKELLEKFDPSQIRDRNSPPTPLIRPSDAALRFRGSPNGALSGPRNTQPSTPIRSYPPSPNLNNSQINRPAVNPGQMSAPRPQMVMVAPRRLPRPILPQDRGVVEKVVDYVVGDGPSNRYALICGICHSHNGMSLKDEFEYLAFRCCYCNSYNPARKVRPFAPQLALPASSGPLVDEPESDVDKSTRSDSPAKKSLNIEDVSSPAKEDKKRDSDSLVTDDDDELEVIEPNGKIDGDHLKDA